MPVYSDHGDFLAFKWGGMRLNIGRHNQVTGQTDEPYRIMINLGVTDIQQEYLRLKTKGVQFIRIPEQEGWGGWVATFKDPDQNTLQLLQLPDACDG